jgi:exoribonuclease-2
VELDSGKRVKVKAANILIKFEKPAPAELLAAGPAASQTIELELAWEFAPEEEFGFADLARDYFSADATLAQQAGMLFRLFEAPHYFRRAGKGRFKQGPGRDPATGAGRHREEEASSSRSPTGPPSWPPASCPEPIREQLYKILFKPDKNAPEYKAVVEASRATHTAAAGPAAAAGAIASPYQFHWQRFLFDNFPQGHRAFRRWLRRRSRTSCRWPPCRPSRSTTRQTTEIDDALSVQGLGSGTVTLGIHIAAPGLAIQPGSAIDQLGRQRLSTVYMPGYKITMLPDDVVQTYTLQEGRDCPAVSLYVTLDEATLEIKASETRLERVPIAANLRHDQLDAVRRHGSSPAEWLENPDGLEHQNGTQPSCRSVVSCSHFCTGWPKT